MTGRLVEEIRNRQVLIREDDSERHEWNPNYVGDAFHIETHGDGHTVHGRVRLAPADEFSLRREIRAHNLGTPDLEVPRPARSALMRARLAGTKRTVA